MEIGLAVEVEYCVAWRNRWNGIGKEWHGGECSKRWKIGNGRREESPLFGLAMGGEKNFLCLTDNDFSFLLRFYSDYYS